MLIMIMQAGRLANETKQIQSGPWAEKGVEADRDIKLASIAKSVHNILASKLKLTSSSYNRARDATRQQFIIDLLDVWIPATNLGLVNLNDGVVGIFGQHCVSKYITVDR